jgi:hypothetical protein
MKTRTTAEFTVEITWNYYPGEKGSMYGPEPCPPTEPEVEIEAVTLIGPDGEDLGEVPSSVLDDGVMDELWEEVKALHEREH